MPPEELLSDVGYNYKRLRDLLAAEKWKQADKETRLIVLRVARCIPKGYLHERDYQRFPCNDLNTLDRLWLDYSNRHFGFSVQKRIWEQVERDYNKFSDRVGWRKENKWLTWGKLTFEKSAPPGHLPSDPICNFFTPIVTNLSGNVCMDRKRGWVKVGEAGWFSALMSRMVECNL